VIIPDRVVYSIVGVVAGFVLLSVFFPMVAVFILFSAAGVVIHLMVYKCFRAGVIHFGVVTYERRDSPIGFWFYMLVGIGSGIFMWVGGILLALHKV
jgi:hypothetical protein